MKARNKWIIGAAALFWLSAYGITSVQKSSTGLPSPTSAKPVAAPQARPVSHDPLSDIPVAQRPGIIQSIEESIRGGDIRLDVNNRSLWIRQGDWQGMDAHQKEVFSFTVAVYCQMKLKVDTRWLEIYDWQSGKKLAKYSQAWGFKVY